MHAPVPWKPASFLPESREKDEVIAMGMQKTVPLPEALIQHQRAWDGSLRHPPFQSLLFLPSTSPQHIPCYLSLVPFQRLLYSPNLVGTVCWQSSREAHNLLSIL